MSDYKPVQDAMAAGTPLELICAACPWDRLCIQPPSMTKADVDKALDEAKAADRGAGKGMQVLMTALVLGGRDSAGQMCPVFATRMREDRRTADAIRSLMRGYEES